jgi:hypothetical protein
MKAHHSIGIVGLLAAALTVNGQADFNGSDDFNDNARDAARWGTDLTAGAGVLTETNGRLEYTTAGVPSGWDLSARPWIAGSGSYTQSWEVRMDVNVPQLPLGTNERVAFGFIVAPGTDLAMAFTNRFYLDLSQSSSSAINRRFTCNVAVNAAETNLAKRATSSTFAALRVGFDANTKVLAAYYDEDGPACGYSWALLAATNIASAWHMTSTSVFTVGVIGHSEYAAVAATDNVFGDNVHASSGLTPRLGIGLAGGNVMLAWSTNAPACHLEFTPTLTPPVCWQIATNPPWTLNTNWAVTNTRSSPATFYRLSR